MYYLREWSCEYDSGYDYYLLDVRVFTTLENAQAYIEAKRHSVLEKDPEHYKSSIEVYEILKSDVDIPYGQESDLKVIVEEEQLYPLDWKPYVLYKQQLEKDKIAEKIKQLEEQLKQLTT